MSAASWLLMELTALRQPPTVTDGIFTIAYKFRVNAFGSWAAASCGLAKLSGRLRR